MWGLRWSATLTEEIDQRDEAEDHREQVPKWRETLKKPFEDRVVRGNRWEQPPKRGEAEDGKQSRSPPRGIPDFSKREAVVSS